MRKTLIFFLCLFIFIFKLSIKSNAKKTICIDFIEYNNLSTENYKDILNSELINDIKKICSKNICSYKLDNDTGLFLRNHKKRVIDFTLDNELKNTFFLKGVKIDTIYFNGCI